MDICLYSNQKQLMLSCIFLWVMLLAGCLPPVAISPTTTPNFVSPTTSRKPENSEISRKIVWLKENSLQLRSISPTDENFSDLQPLKHIIGDKTIVMLGEESHGDGNTFLAKIRLIKFLHQEMGFDVIAFESGFYDCHKAWEITQNGESFASAFKQSIFPIWGESNQVQPLISYLDQMKKSEHPLILSGFDSQFTGAYSRAHLLNDLTAFLSKYPGVALQGEELDNFINQTRYLVLSTSSTKVEELTKYLNEVEMLIQSLKTIAKQDNPETAFWLQFLESLASQAEFAWRSIPAGNEQLHAHPELLSIRDIQMGRNLIWLAKENHPDKKIIVWAATYHIARNLASVHTDNKEVQFQHENITTMGDTVGRVLNDQIYALGFTAYTGSFGSIFEIAKKLNPPSENSFEDMMYKASLNYAIVDLRQPPVGGEWLQEQMVSRPLGYEEETADWSRVLDGIMFIKEMIPSTR